MGTTFVNKETFLDKRVICKDGLLKGKVGLCTADLPPGPNGEDNIFAVLFDDGEWITFRPNSEKNNFCVLSE